MIRANNYTKAPNQNKVWKVAIYIRLSRDDGNDESLSVTNQRMIIHDYLENSFDSEYTVVNHYIDDGLWGVNTVSRILKNPMYIGTMVQGKQRTISYKVHDKVQPSEDEWYVVENTHEPIIDKSIFDLAQNLMKRNTRTAPSKRHVHTFSGFLKCADCGMSMARKTTRRNTKKFGVRELVRYICSTFSQKSKDKCTNHTIKLEELNEAVLRAIQVQIALVDDMAAVIKEINKQPVIQIQSKQLKQLLETKKQELEKVTNVTDNLYVDWKSGDITKQEYIRMKSKFEQQANELKENIRNVESEIAVSQKGVSITDSYLTTFLKHKNIQTLERGLLLELVDIIYIHENKKITIKFNFEDQHKRMLEFIQQNKKATHDNKNQVM